MVSTYRASVWHEQSEKQVSGINYNELAGMFPGMEFKFNVSLEKTVSRLLSLMKKDLALVVVFVTDIHGDIFATSQTYGEVNVQRIIDDIAEFDYEGNTFLIGHIEKTKKNQTR